MKIDLAVRSRRRVVAGGADPGSAIISTEEAGFSAPGYNSGAA